MKNSEIIYNETNYCTHHIIMIMIMMMMIITQRKKKKRKKIKKYENKVNLIFKRKSHFV